MKEECVLKDVCDEVSNDLIDYWMSLPLICDCCGASLCPNKIVGGRERVLGALKSKKVIHYICGECSSKALIEPVEISTHKHSYAVAMHEPLMFFFEKGVVSKFSDFYMVHVDIGLGGDTLTCSVLDPVGKDVFEIGDEVSVIIESDIRFIVNN